MKLDSAAGRGLHALHALLLAFPIALFTSALVADITYLQTAEIQWTNFASWLIAGALVFGGLVGVFALFGLIFNLRSSDRNRRIVYFAVVAAMWVLGFINAFKHSQDGWSSVGTLGVALSALCTGLALVAGYLKYSEPLVRETAR